jgi:hypothetical protein
MALPTMVIGIDVFAPVAAVAAGLSRPRNGDHQGYGDDGHPQDGSHSFLLASIGVDLVADSVDYDARDAERFTKKSLARWWAWCSGFKKLVADCV